MNATVHDESDDADSDVFIIKQIKPVNKCTVQTTLYNRTLSDSVIPKKLLINGSKSKSSKLADKNLRVKKQNSFSGTASPIKRSVSFGSFQSDIRNHFRREANTSNYKVGETIEPSNIGYNPAQGCGNSNSKNLTPSKNNESPKIKLSPGISKRRKKFKLDESDKSPNKKVKKPLIDLFDSMDGEVSTKGEIIITSESNNVLDKKGSNNEVVEKNFKSDESSQILNDSKKFEQSDIAELLSLEDNILEEFQKGYLSPESNSVNKDDNSYQENSELMCVLLKQIVRDESEKQLILEDKCLKRGKMIEKLLSASDCNILNKFFSLQPKACRVFVRMLTRKKTWHRTVSISYRDIGENLTDEFEILVKEKFLDNNLEDEDLKIQLNLLTKPEVLNLYKTFNIGLKFNNAPKKEVLIENLIKDNQKQQSVIDMFKGKNSRLDLLKSALKKELGLCVKINNIMYQVFYKVILLFSFNHYYDEEEKRFSNVLLKCMQVHKNFIKFPAYKVSPTVIFETRSDFDDYLKAILTQDSFDIAVSNKNFEEFICVSNKAKNEFKKLLKDSDYTLRFSNLPSFLKKFSAGNVYARILTTYIKTFKKQTDTSEIIETAKMLLEQNFFLLRKRGEWYEVLSKALENLKQVDSSAEVLIRSLKDPHVSEVQKLALQFRGQHILKKKSGGLKDECFRKELEELCIVTIEEPQSVEISGKALGGNESGFKCVYIQNIGSGKMYSSVEERAISHYKLNGFTKGYHCEGQIIQTIYFLLFFDIIYGLSPEGVFQNSYQDAPLDISSSCFYYNRKEEIDLYLSDIINWSDEELEIRVKDTYYKNYNVTCIIKWSDQYTPELLIEVVKCIKLPALVLIFQRFIRNFRATRSGFPDLTLWNPETNKCKFVEVKSPNDKLSPAQRIWLDYLKNIGLDCEVCNVKNTNSKKLD